MENSKKDRFDGTLNDALLILEETKSKKSDERTEDSFIKQEKQKKTISNEEEGWEEEEGYEEEEYQEEEEEEARSMEKKESKRADIDKDDTENDEELEALRKQKKKKDFQTLAVLFFLAVVMLIGAYFMFFAATPNIENQDEQYTGVVSEPTQTVEVKPVVEQRIETEYTSVENPAVNNGQQEERISEEYATQASALPEAIPASEPVIEIELVCTALSADVAVNIFAVVNGVAYIATDIFTSQTFKTLPKKEVSASFNDSESVFIDAGGFYLLKSHVEKFYKCE